MADSGSRRGFLLGLLAVPAAFAGAKALGALRRGAELARPSARGHSSGVCGVCGRGDHTMLDPRCPGAAEVV